MESLYLLIPLSVVLVFIIGALFWWSLRNGQYDDLEGPAYRLLMDDKDEFPASRCDATSAPKVAKADKSGADGKMQDVFKLVSIVNKTGINFRIFILIFVENCL